MSNAHTQSADFQTLLRQTRSGSRYAHRLLEAEPALSDWLEDCFATSFNRAAICHLLEQLCPDIDDENALTGALRKLRKRVMLKLILRDLGGLADLDEVMNTMTVLAEVSVQYAQHCLSRVLAQQFGHPVGEESHTRQQLLVIGMGKLGGGELNVSSDIDLIFVYAEDGETDGQRQLGNHEYFTRLGRRLIQMINEYTADGYVFRVDMRLRPYGDSGPLVMSFSALEEYLVRQGREWERYAWIKARVISPGNDTRIAELNNLSLPFVFRKYLDFGAIDSMRKLHAQIRQEVHRKERLNNIKLGPGGIREIEFIAQVFQLIRGGQNAKLRIRPTRQVLRVIAASGKITPDIVAKLDCAYIFLRNLEHRLQYLDDQQTQELPEKTADREIIAAAMNYPNYPDFLAELNQHRAIVSGQFEQIFGAPETGQHETSIWGEGITLDDLTRQLEIKHYRNAPETAQRLLQFRGSKRYCQLPDPSRQRLDKLIPQFIALSANRPQPDETLVRLLALLESISRRAVYLAFLDEYPQVLQRLTKLVASSNWAGEYLTRHPALFDELLDARELYQPPQWQQIKRDLDTRLLDCADDIERQMNVLRQFQQQQIFYLLAMDLQDLLPLENLSDHLSDLADLILERVLTLCWQNARKRHRDEPRFAIFSYGKLGGKELGYASDLDLIFLYRDDHADAQEIYARLGKSISTMLGSYTACGRLYEIDLRLRPNGESGLLVSSVDAFSDYQKNHAWVWEHQALTRARFSAGDTDIGAAFEDIRKAVLSQPRDPGILRREIVAMRHKMHQGHPNPGKLFDIKHDSGGMVDIEFMVQYLVLAHAHQYPQLTGNIGNLALLKMAAELGLIPPDLAEEVRTLYRTLRQTQHRMRLNQTSPCRIPHNEINVAAGIRLWEMLFAGTSPS
ncbi:MAG: bifunctional [glutamate--ammonia ligase]-adenylyl-L-tyrosine phosphorylase/[glutamate--ammonia-ligase] adenylyltransferase [Pseudomonadota bacterium]